MDRGLECDDVDTCDMSHVLVVMPGAHIIRGLW
jgi:hypothetical protein